MLEISGTSVGWAPTDETSSNACSPRARNEVERRLDVWAWLYEQGSTHSISANNFFQGFMMLPVFLGIFEFTAARCKLAFFEICIFLEDSSGAFFG